MKKPERRIDGSLLVSIALHIVVGAALVLVLSIPNPIRQWLTDRHGEQPRSSTSRTSQTPSAGSATARSGGDNVPVRGKSALRPLVAPTTIPTAVPPAPVSTEPPSGAGPSWEAAGPVRA